MKTTVETWDESIMDLEDYQAERAMQKGIIDAMRRARQLGDDFIMEEDGRTKRVPPQETVGLEKDSLANLDRLNRIIAELEAKQPSSSALTGRPTGNASPTNY